MYGLQFQSLYHHNKFPIKTNSLYVLICNWAKVFVSTNCYKSINLRDCTLIHCIVHHIQLKHNIKSFVIIALSVDFWLITLKTIAWYDGSIAKKEISCTVFPSSHHVRVTLNKKVKVTFLLGTAKFLFPNPHYSNTPALQAWQK